DEQRGERDPAPLAAAERAHRGLPREVPHEPADDVAHPGVAGPLVLRAVTDDRVPDGGGRVEVVALREDPETHPAAPGHPARLRLDGPGEHSHEAGLAVAVAADDADAVPFVDAEGDRVQDDARGVL